MNTPSLLRLTAAIGVLTAIGLTSPANALAQSQPLSPEQLTFFESKIRPVLIKECYSCHSTQTGNAKGGLRLDTEALTQLGGSSGPAIVPGDLVGSLLYTAITHQDFEMPPRGRLPQNVIDDFRTWIEMGAPDPRKTDIGELNSKITAEMIEAAKAEFWAYQVPKPHALPAVKDEGWIRNDIDRFVLAKLDDAGLIPNQDAEPYQVLRRLSYDLIGLPPDSEQLESFVQIWNRNPDDAIAVTVDRLLDSPQFGERWARHWLDIARYAESNGREINMTHPQAWRYRDYVIDSFNKDKPYDRFVQEQIAGDLLPVKSDEQWAENLIATTFLALGPKSLSEQNPVQFRADLVDEQIDTTTRVFMGMSVACARCHDHKFDPIPQTDYYAMAGIFSNTDTFFGAPASQFGSVGGIQNRNTSALILLPVPDPNPFDKSYTKDELEDMTAQMTELRKELFEYRMAMRSGRSDGANSQTSIMNLVRTQTRMESLSSTLGSVDKEGKPLTFCMGAQDREAPRDVRLLVRGEIDQQAQVVPRGFPKVISEDASPIAKDSSGRLELARWIASEKHPLTARVMANRIWQQMIGSGIVRSTEDFGSTGQSPTHPELLDHLALRLVASHWSMKSLIREIAISRVYRMSTQFDTTRFDKDPDNNLLWRANPRRLDAEAIRDSMLFVSGKLNTTRPRASEVAKAGYMQVRDGSLVNIAQFTMMSGEGDMRESLANQMRQRAAERMSDASGDRLGGGRFDRSRPGFVPGMMGGPGFGQRFGQGPGMFGGSSEPVDMVDATYRSVYLPILRDELPRVLEVFDFAEPSMVIGTREASNTPNQALFMLNNELVLKQSAAIANRIMERTDSMTESVEKAFVLIYGRLPTTSELSAAREFVDQYSPESRSSQKTFVTLSGLCQSLLASAEFRFVD